MTLPHLPAPEAGRPVVLRGPWIVEQQSQVLI